MKKIYRKINIDKYWDNRWKEFPKDIPFTSLNIYPIKYTEQTIKIARRHGIRDPHILECGCGLGRVLLHYYWQGRHIKGFDKNKLAIKKVRKFGSFRGTVNPFRTANVVKSLPYKENEFDIAFAFGLFHNLASGYTQAVRNVVRCVSKGGFVCFSFAANSLGTWLRELNSQGKHFYKYHYDKLDVLNLMEECGLDVKSIETIENIPILYKYKVFRKKKRESVNRSEGYELNWFAGLVNKYLFKWFPEVFGDTIVVIGRKR
jgi:SAM-dependent methyltransferase